VKLVSSYEDALRDPPSTIVYSSSIYRDPLILIEQSAFVTVMLSAWQSRVSEIFQSLDVISSAFLIGAFKYGNAIAMLKGAK
jgi:hypothetical protein